MTIRSKLIQYWLKAYDLFVYVRAYTLHFAWLLCASIVGALTSLEWRYVPYPKVIYAVDEHRRDITNIVHVFYRATAEPTCTNLIFFLTHAAPEARSRYITLYFSTDPGKVRRARLDLAEEMNVTFSAATSLKYGCIQLEKMLCEELQ